MTKLILLAAGLLMLSGCYDIASETYGIYRVNRLTGEVCLMPLFPARHELSHVPHCEGAES